MHYASHADIDAMAGKETAAGPAWTLEEVRAMDEFMGRWTDEPVESGEFVDAAGLAAPVLIRTSTGRALEISWGQFATGLVVPVLLLTLQEAMSRGRARR
jgi:hypothetical protein